jgi:hypothetical protein
MLLLVAQFRILCSNCIVRWVVFRELGMFSSRMKPLVVLLVILAVAALPYLAALADMAPGGGR